MMAKTNEPRIRLYFPNLLLTFLLVFCLIGTELMLLVQHTALNAEAFRKVEEESQSVMSKLTGGLGGFGGFGL